MRRMLVVLPAVLLAGACSSGHTTALTAPTPSAAGTTSASPTPSPTPAVLTLAQAKAAYLRLVKPSNRDIARINAATASSSPSLATIRKIARTAALDEHNFAIALRSTLWPPDVKPSALRLADAVAGDVPAWTTVAHDTTLSGAEADLSDVAGAKVSKAVEQMREALALPPAR